MRSDPITGTSSSPPVMPMGDGGSISTFTSLSGTSLLLTNVAVSVASAGFAVLRTQVAPRISMSPGGHVGAVTDCLVGLHGGLSVESRPAARQGWQQYGGGGDRYEAATGCGHEFPPGGGGAVGTLSGAGPAIKGDSTALTGRGPGLRTFNRMNTACYDGVHGRDNSTYGIFRRRHSCLPTRSSSHRIDRAARDQGVKSESIWFCASIRAIWSSGCRRTTSIWSAFATW